MEAYASDTQPPDPSDFPESADPTSKLGEVPNYPEPEHPTRWWLWVRRIAGSDTQLEIAHKMSVDKYHPTRWKQGNRPAAEFVVRFAEAYNRSPLEALVEAEYLTPEQAGLQYVVEDRTITDLSEASSQALLDELARRIEH